MSENFADAAVERMYDAWNDADGVPSLILADAQTQHGIRHAYREDQCHMTDSFLRFNGVPIVIDESLAPDCVKVLCYGEVL